MVESSKRTLSENLILSASKLSLREIFTVFLPSRSARGLVAQQAKLMVDSPIGVHRRDVGQMSRTLILLLLGQGCADVEEGLKQAVVRRLEGWVAEFKDFAAAENCASCLWVLTGSR